jgi:hypothetical protein
MIRVTSSGDTRRTESFLDAMIRDTPYRNAERFAARGVEALRQATPRDSGLTAESWSYEIRQNGSSFTIWWSNSNVVNGFNVAVGLQDGHGTGSGGYVQGRDYINPALAGIFKAIIDDVWKEVQKA